MHSAEVSFRIVHYHIWIWILKRFQRLVLLHHHEQHRVSGVCIGMGGYTYKLPRGLHFTIFVYFLMFNIFICLFSWDDYEGYLRDGDQTKGFRISGFSYSHHSCMLGHSNQGVKGRIGGNGRKGTFFRLSHHDGRWTS